MRKSLVRMVMLALLVGSALVVTACGKASSPALQTTLEAEAMAPPVRVGNTVIADARVTPVRSAALGLPTGGVVAQVLVAEGDRVEAGQVLVRLDTIQQSAAVTQAEAALDRAQAVLAELEAGAREEEIAIAEEEVEAALAKLAGAQAEMKIVLGHLTAAEAQVTAAQAKLTATEALLVAAQAQRRAVQADLAQLQAGARKEEIAAAEAALRSAQVTLDSAKQAYDPIAWQPGVDFSPVGLTYRQALATVEAAQARLDLLKAGATAEALQQAQAKVDAAKANADAAQANVDAAQAAVEVAQADVEGVLAYVEAAQANIDAAQAQVNQAELQLALVEAGARPEQVAAAEADVASAEAALAQARDALAWMELRALFAGVVASLDVKVGEQAAPGVPIVWLADVSAWQIETEDLTELDVVRIQEGDSATITFDAIPDLALPGKVVHIKDLGENKQGDMTYTVVVEPDEQDDRLRWNMTASVSIEPK